MKKVLVGVLIVLLLVGCEDSSKKETNTAVIFKEELATVSKIGDAKGKSLVNEILPEEIEKIFNNIFDLAIFESSSFEFGDIIQGAGSDGNGGRVFCCKLPVNVKFTGGEAAVKRFVEYFNELDNVISFGDFKVIALEDEKYEVTTVINFLGKATSGTLSSGEKKYTIRKNEVEVKEAEEISLRDFDISMVIRPSNSDSAAISLGVTEEKDYRVYSDGNLKQDINITFSNEGNKYYCEYSIGGMNTTKAEIKPSGSILFDILSCDVVRDDDEIATDLYITNNSNKKVSIVIYDDEDGRVNVVEKVGSVEVKKK